MADYHYIRITHRHTHTLAKRVRLEQDEDDKGVEARWLVIKGRYRNKLSLLSPPVMP